MIIQIWRTINEEASNSAAMDFKDKDRLGITALIHSIVNTEVSIVLHIN